MPTSSVNFTYPTPLLAWGKSDFRVIDWQEENDGKRYDAHRTWRGNTDPWQKTLPPIAAQFTQRPVDRAHIKKLSQPLRSSASKPPVLAQFISRPVNYERLREMGAPKPVIAYQDPETPARHTYFPSKKYMKWLETSAETREPFNGKTHSSPADKVRKFMSNKYGSVLLGWEAMGGDHTSRVHQEAFIKALIAMEYPHDPRDGYNDLAPKTRDFVILSDLDVQAARALKENPKYAKKRKQERKAKANAEAKPPAVGALERLSAALLEKFPDRQTAWDEFLDPEGVGGLTKAALMHAVQALGLAGFVKVIPGDVRGFVRELMQEKKSEGELFLLGDLAMVVRSHDVAIPERKESDDDPRSPKSEAVTARSEAGASLQYDDIDTLQDFGTETIQDAPSYDGRAQTPLSGGGLDIFYPESPAYSDADIEQIVADAQELSAELAHNVLGRTILSASQSMPDLERASTVIEDESRVHVDNVSFNNEPAS
jgi:hypothetical protein